MVHLELLSGARARRRRRSWPELLTWHRDFVRLAVVLAAFNLDGLCICLAAFLAANLRYASLAFSSNSNDLIAVILPVYVLAGLALGIYRTSTLGALFRSVRLASGSLLVASAVGLSAAFAFKATATYSRLETLYFFGFAMLKTWKRAVASLHFHS